MKDPFLAGLPARDVSIPLFIVLYGTVCIGVHHLFRERRLLRALQAYVLLLVLRMCTLALVPLGPPPGLVPLQDPLTRWFYPDALPFEKDLFFSGHTATLFLLYLALPNGWRKGSAMLATVVVGLAVMVQHVHWTVDVLAAPVAAALSWWWSGYTARFADLPATRSPGSLFK
ncbi:MAG: phosphatase PAP2-related protein [Flavobacteriales bacterium]